MKIEKINDRQIRCTLTKEDLASRQIKLSELAYGSDKAKQLFQDMMHQAYQEVGFEVDNRPLMIEAIPLSMDKILLVVTKVDESEELDSRFSRFSPDGTSAAQNSGNLLDYLEKVDRADDIIDLIQKISEMHENNASAKQENTKAEEALSKEKEKPEKDAGASSPSEQRLLTHFYVFRTMDDVICAAAATASFPASRNSLYKNPENGEFYLVICKDQLEAEDFNKICNILSEYALSCKYTPGIEAFFAEHMEVILAENALQKLKTLF